MCLIFKFKNTYYLKIIEILTGLLLLYKYNLQKIF